MNTQHTPGPWSVHWAMAQSGDASHIVDGRDMAELSVIATVHFHDDVEGETKANARLIAAAPDMLEALVKVEALLDAIKLTDYPVLDELYVVQAAIAKAKGQP